MPKTIKIGSYALFFLRYSVASSQISVVKKVDSQSSNHLQFFRAWTADTCTNGIRTGNKSNHSFQFLVSGSNGLCCHINPLLSQFLSITLPYISQTVWCKILLHFSDVLNNSHITVTVYKYSSRKPHKQKLSKQYNNHLAFVTHLWPPGAS